MNSFELADVCVRGPRVSSRQMHYLHKNVALWCRVNEAQGDASLKPWPQARALRRFIQHLHASSDPSCVLPDGETLDVPSPK